MAERNPHYGIDGDRDEWLFDGDDEIVADGESIGTVADLHARQAEGLADVMAAFRSALLAAGLPVTDENGQPVWPERGTE